MADLQTSSLYEEDFYLWSLDQARALRALRDAASGLGDLSSALNAIDWDHAIEELEGLAKRDRRELQSRINMIVEHLTKLEHSTDARPRAGWQNTVRRERGEIELLLQQSPSLRREIVDFLASPSAAKRARQAIEQISGRSEAPGPPEPRRFTETQILDDWWPAP